MRPLDSFVGQPIRSLQTMLRVLAEDDESLPTVVADGIYSQDTMTAVSTFQRKYSLPITGIVDQATWDLIVEKYNDAFIRIYKAQPIEIILDPGEVIFLGDSSPYLYLLQGMLTFLSTLHPTISIPSFNGVLDPQTSESIRRFQMLAGLPETGNLDKITWKHLVHHYTLNANVKK